MLLGPSIARNRAAGRGRNRPGLTLAARLEREAIAAARRNNASLWYVRNDLSNVAQNTDGSGSATLNAPVGLLLDQQWGGALGPELSNGYSLTITGSRYGGQMAGFTAGKTYRVRATVTKTSGTSIDIGVTGVDYLWLANGASRNVTSNGTSVVDFILVASSSYGDATVIFTGGAVGQVTGLSVQEVLGVHANQATTANKPLLTRVPRTLGPELVVNGGFDSASNWTTENSTWIISGGVASHSGVAANIYQPGLITIGRAYRIEFTWAGSITGYLRCYAGFGASYSLAAGTAPGRVAVTLTCSGDTILYFQSDSAVSIDNVSVREVLEWSYAAQFDRSNDYLLTSLLCGDAGTFIAAHHTIRQTGAWQGVVTTGSQPNSANRGLRLRIRSDLFSAGVDAANATMSQTAESPAVLVDGGPIVNTGWWSAASINSSVNGAAPSSTVLGSGIGNGAPFMIGALTNAGGDALAGPLSLVCIANTVLPDADRQAIERFGAYLIGAPYAA